MLSLTQNIMELKNTIQNVYNGFLDMIYKKKCLICGCSKTDDLLCKTCLKDVQFLSCFAHKIYEKIPIYSATIYDKNIKSLIQMLKFKHKKSASKPLTNILFSYFKKLNLKDDFIIIYPPSFFIKSAQRGYNHMFLIAKEFSKLTGFKVNNKIIIKIKPTKPQYKAKDRRKNIKGSFKINQKELSKLKNKKLLLIDDITTSGATLEEIINCFLKLNFDNITCLTISKTK